ACGARISPRYPALELLTGVLSVAVVWHFGASPQAAGALLLTWALVALAFIDLDTQLLPDSITMPFLWLGLAFNLAGVYTTLHASVIGAVAGYGVLWIVFHTFRLLTGKEGMGYGDFKLLALLGAWLGWQQLPVIVLLSSLIGALVGVAMIALRGHDRNVPIPFGPYLAMAGWVAMLWGDAIARAYLSSSGISG
ncbi:MAG: A24 family peptidase, partial [Gammaproteobacteria bacterium]|nr:A24 family peptidase [Gammaproteobacteria bacterium]